MTFVCAFAALRRHLLSVSCTVLLLVVFASLFGTPVPLALFAWVVTSLGSIELWRRFEPFILRWLGCRAPDRLECERLQPVLDSTRIDTQRYDTTLDRVDILLLDSPQPWLGIGVHSVVISRALLDVLDDRALVGLLSQAILQLRSASLAGELIVWLGNLPLLGLWCVGRWLARLGGLLAVVVGTALVLPMVFCPERFTRWVGRFFGAFIVVVLGAVLLAHRLAGPGLGLLIGGLVVPGLAMLLGWERRRVERHADAAIVAAGLGWQLLEALETLAWADSLVAPAFPLGLLSGLHASITERADRIWRALAQA